MRVLYATDGSEQSAAAGRLVASMAWPAGSSVRVVCAVDAGAAFFGAPLAPAVPANADLLEQQLRDDGKRIVEAAVAELSSANVAVDCMVADDRPATAVVEEARDWPADLIVMGSRGHGQIASMVLGSVSAEVVDHAPCPVLVARRPTFGRAILGHDGSACARHAETVIAEWPIFAGVAIEVVSIAPGGPPWAAGLAQTMYAGSMDAYVDSAKATITADSELAEAAARRLRLANRQATSSVSEGAPATELIRLAEERAADVIVIGTRGQTGLRRLLVGSVARNVMQHAHCSVLIVR
jgi:nucleotide-binding universal stress UspA family protein